MLCEKVDFGSFQQTLSGSVSRSPPLGKTLWLKHFEFGPATYKCGLACTPCRFQRQCIKAENVLKISFVLTGHLNGGPVPTALKVPTRNERFMLSAVDRIVLRSNKSRSRWQGAAGNESVAAHPTGCAATLEANVVVR